MWSALNFEEDQPSLDVSPVGRVPGDDDDDDDDHLHHLLAISQSASLGDMGFDVNLATAATNEDNDLDLGNEDYVPESLRAFVLEQNLKLNQERDSFFSTLVADHDIPLINSIDDYDTEEARLTLELRRKQDTLMSPDILQATPPHPVAPNMTETEVKRQALGETEERISFNTPGQQQQHQQHEHEQPSQQETPRDLAAEVEPSRTTIIDVTRLQDDAGSLGTTPCKPIDVDELSPGADTGTGVLVHRVETTAASTSALPSPPKQIQQQASPNAATEAASTPTAGGKHSKLSSPSPAPKKTSISTSPSAWKKRAQVAPLRPCHSEQRTKSSSVSTTPKKSITTPKRSNLLAGLSGRLTRPTISSASHQSKKNATPVASSSKRGSRQTKPVVASSPSPRSNSYGQETRNEVSDSMPSTTESAQEELVSEFVFPPELSFSPDAALKGKRQEVTAVKSNQESQPGISENKDQTTTTTPFQQQAKTECEQSSLLPRPTEGAHDGVVSSAQTSNIDTPNEGSSMMSPESSKNEKLGTRPVCNALTEKQSAKPASVDATAGSSPNRSRLHFTQPTASSLARFAKSRSPHHQSSVSSPLSSDGRKIASPPTQDRSSTNSHASPSSKDKQPSPSKKFTFASAISKVTSGGGSFTLSSRLTQETASSKARNTVASPSSKQKVPVTSPVSGSSVSGQTSSTLSRIFEETASSLARHASQQRRPTTPKESASSSKKDAATPQRSSPSKSATNNKEIHRLTAKTSLSQSPHRTSTPPEQPRTEPSSCTTPQNSATVLSPPSFEPDRFTAETSSSLAQNAPPETLKMEPSASPQPPQKETSTLSPPDPSATPTRLMLETAASLAHRAPPPAQAKADTTSLQNIVSKSPPPAALGRITRQTASSLAHHASPPDESKEPASTQKVAPFSDEVLSRLTRETKSSEARHAPTSEPTFSSSPTRPIETTPARTDSTSVLMQLMRETTASKARRQKQDGGAAPAEITSRSGSKMFDKAKSSGLSVSSRLTQQTASSQARQVKNRMTSDRQAKKPSTRVTSHVTAAGVEVQLAAQQASASDDEGEESVDLMHITSSLTQDSALTDGVVSKQSPVSTLDTALGMLQQQDQHPHDSSPPSTSGPHIPRDPLPTSVSTTTRSRVESSSSRQPSVKLTTSGTAPKRATIKGAAVQSSSRVRTTTCTVDDGRAKALERIRLHKLEEHRKLAFDMPHGAGRSARAKVMPPRQPTRQVQNRRMASEGKENSARLARQGERVVKKKADPTLAQSTDVLRSGLRQGYATSSSFRRTPTIPKTPNFATSKRHGEKASVRDHCSEVTLAQSHDVLKRELRSDSSTVSGQGSTRRKISTVPCLPPIVSKVPAPRPMVRDIPLARSNDVLRSGLRAQDPSLMQKRNPTLTVPIAPKFHKISVREKPKSTEERELEEIQYYKSHPFKARPVSRSSDAVRVVVKPALKPSLATTTKDRKDASDLKMQFPAKPVSNFLLSPAAKSTENKQHPVPVSTIYPNSSLTPKSPLTMSSPGSVTNVKAPTFSTAARTSKRQAIAEASRRKAEAMHLQRQMEIKAREREKIRQGMIKFEQSRIAVPANAKPFTLHSELRGEEHQRKFEEKIQQEEEERRRKAEFHALDFQPHQTPPLSARKRPERIVTEVQPFNLRSVPRHEAAEDDLQRKLEEEKEELKRLSQFKALPVPKTTYMSPHVRETPSSIRREEQSNKKLLLLDDAEPPAPTTNGKSSSFKARPVPQTTYSFPSPAAKASNAAAAAKTATANTPVAGTGAND